MKARAVCVPIGRPLVGISLVPVVILIFSLVALLLTSCTNSATPDANQVSVHAATAKKNHDFAYEYFDSTNTPIQKHKRFDADENLPVATLDEMRSLTNIPAQTFTVKAKKDTVIVGKKGIKVHIPSNCFELENPNAEVKIILKEYNSAADLFFANLTTGSNGQMLESGGTVYINAVSDGKQVNLKKGKQLSFAFPTGKAKPDMQTFYGEKKGDGSINWQPAETGETKTFTRTEANAVLFTSGNYDPISKKAIRWKEEKIKKVRYTQRTSTLTGWKFQIQAFGSNDLCTRFLDSSEYKNVLEYFRDNFTITPTDFKLLKGSYFYYNYSIANNGVVTKKPTLRLDFHAKAGLFNKKSKREAVVRLKNQIVALLQNMPKAEPSENNRQEILRLYINEFSFCKNGPIIKVNDNKVKKEYWDIVWHPDSVDAKTYQAWLDSLETAAAVRRDSLMKNDAEYYFLNSGKLGWINCDRFYDNNKPKRDIIVKADENTNLTVKVVFKEILSVLPLYATGKNGAYKAENVPMDEEVRFIVIDKRDDGLYYAVKDGITSTEKVEGFTFKPMTMKAIKDELASLN